MYLRALFRWLLPKHAGSVAPEAPVPAPAAARAYDSALGRARTVAVGMAAVIIFGVAGSPIPASARNTGQVQRPLGVQQLVIARADAAGSLAGHFASNAVDGDSPT